MQEKIIVTIDDIKVECFFDGEKEHINTIIKEAFKEYVIKNLGLR